jgi:hypothetical protein|tara:strand:- start:108 stop:290 length:183 start_codon:yes stop_codon:yes gene_type:complete
MISNWQLPVLVLLFLAAIGWSAASITIAISEQTKAINKVGEHLYGISHTTVRIEERLPRS